MSFSRFSTEKVVDYFRGLRVMVQAREDLSYNYYESEFVLCCEKCRSSWIVKVPRDSTLSHARGKVGVTILEHRCPITIADLDDLELGPAGRP